VTRPTIDRSLLWIALASFIVSWLLLSQTCSGQDVPYSRTSNGWFTAGRISHLALQGVDTATTVYAINSGIGRERNPLIRGVVSHGFAFVAVKTTVAIGLDMALRKGHTKHPRLTLATVWAVTALYGAIVANNVRVIRGAR
jgi:hypothetical protein